MFHNHAYATLFAQSKLQAQTFYTDLIHSRTNLMSETSLTLPRLPSRATGPDPFQLLLSCSVSLSKRLSSCVRQQNGFCYDILAGRKQVFSAIPSTNSTIACQWRVATSALLLTKVSRSTYIKRVKDPSIYSNLVIYPLWKWVGKLDENQYSQVIIFSPMSSFTLSQ